MLLWACGRGKEEIPSVTSPHPPAHVKVELTWTQGVPRKCRTRTPVPQTRNPISQVLDPLPSRPS